LILGRVSTLLDPAIIRRLGLRPTGLITVHTPTTAGTPQRLPL